MNVSRYFQERTQEEILDEMRTEFFFNEYEKPWNKDHLKSS